MPCHNFANAKRRRRRRGGGGMLSDMLDDNLASERKTFLMASLKSQ
jgi:hypothetical protein